MGKREREAEQRPEARDVDSLSPVAQDYLKTIWSTTEWGQAPISAKGLAEKFGTSPASVTDTVKRLAGMGLVAYTPYRPVELTAAGRALAVQMVRRHRLIETFLVERLGYGWDEVHDEAERLEHAVSDDFTARIDALLGRPSHDPHGDPIPDASGRTHRDAGTVALAQASGPQAFEVVRVSDADPEVLAAAAKAGITPGARVEVGADGAVCTSAGSQGSPVPAAIAAALWVRPAG